jgi:hypothetical protein
LAIKDNWRSYFWNVNDGILDIEDDRDLIMERLLIWGEVEDWRWLVETYGSNSIIAWIREHLDTDLAFFDEMRVFWAWVALGEKLTPDPRRKWKANTRIVPETA